MLKTDLYSTMKSEYLFI